MRTIQKIFILSALLSLFVLSVSAATPETGATFTRDGKVTVMARATEQCTPYLAVYSPEGRMLTVKIGNPLPGNILCTTTFQVGELTEDMTVKVMFLSSTGYNPLCPPVIAELDDGSGEIVLLKKP